MRFYLYSPVDHSESLEKFFVTSKRIASIIENSPSRAEKFACILFNASMLNPQDEFYSACGEFPPGFVLTVRREMV